MNCVSNSPLQDTHKTNKEHSLTVHQDAVFPTLPEGDLWVFGYGSLMWRPGFDYIEKVDGRIFGYHRALCILSWVHRGTEQQPGLVLGLDKGGSCTGKLYRIKAADKERVAQYLYARELPTLVYNSRVADIHTTDGRCIKALTFVVDTHHSQYTQGQSIQQLADIVKHAAGINGKSSDYLLSTLQQLRANNVVDRRLEAIAACL